MCNPDIPTEPQLVGYARVSTAEQSLDMQIRGLLDYGVPENNIWSEKRSATSQRRPKLEECLQYLAPGDTLVVYKLDRLARSMKDLLERLEYLEDRGIKFMSLTERIETVTPGGKLIAGVLAALAQFERDLVAERTTSGMAAKRKRCPDWTPGPTRKLTGAALKYAQGQRDKGKTAKDIIAGLKDKYKIVVSPRTIYLRTRG